MNRTGILTLPIRRLLVRGDRMKLVMPFLAIIAFAGVSDTCVSASPADARTGIASYNPYDSRWHNRDPLAEAGGLNLYTFGDPINSVDPTGLIMRSQVDYLGRVYFKDEWKGIDDPSVDKAMLRRVLLAFKADLASQSAYFKDNKDKQQWLEQDDEEVQKVLERLRKDPQKSPWKDFAVAFPGDVFKERLDTDVVVATVKDALAGYRATGGTVKFTPAFALALTFQEGRFKPAASPYGERIFTNDTTSDAVGMMQVTRNSYNVPKIYSAEFLQTYNAKVKDPKAPNQVVFDETQLTDPTLNIMVGFWIFQDKTRGKDITTPAGLRGAIMAYRGKTSPKYVDTLLNHTAVIETLIEKYVQLDKNFDVLKLDPKNQLHHKFLLELNNQFAKWGF